MYHVCRTEILETPMATQKPCASGSVNKNKRKRDDGTKKKRNFVTAIRYDLIDGKYYDKDPEKANKKEKQVNERRLYRLDE